MFMGEFQHNLDDKGRLTIPAKFREELGERFVATKGLDTCLFVYPMGEWRNIENKLKDLPLTSADARAFVRFFLSGATECELDKQYRIILPDNLRTYARIERECMVLGVSSRVEIWAKAEWEHYSQKAELNYEQIAEKLIGF